MNATAYRQRIAELERELAEAKAEARTDSLTGLGNRRRYDESLGLAGRTCVVFDAANLKAANDVLGHTGADDLLRAIASAIRCEAGDAVTCRHGGDEFSVFLEGVTDDEARGVIRRIERAVGTTQIIPGLSMFLVGGLNDDEVESRKRDRKRQLGEPLDRAGAEALIAAHKEKRHAA